MTSAGEAVLFWVLAPISVLGALGTWSSPRDASNRPATAQPGTVDQWTRRATFSTCVGPGSQAAIQGPVPSLRSRTPASSQV